MKGWKKCWKIENAFVHLYGKKETRPGRKMGHVTIMGKEKQDLLDQSIKIKKDLLSIS
jgi:5-(carboxyamino)imidazole ribonucleotide synthase